MRNENFYNRTSMGNQFSLANLGLSRKSAVGLILIVALLAFEIFNFDTTQYALGNLLGDVRFLGIQWASILAIAFCSIDFAGLIRLFTPERGFEERKEVWYLMGAWLLGATMNAVMTWWAISLTLLNHGFGNEVLTRDQLLLYVPIFVAVLVWLTRILFIGAFTVAGDHIFDFAGTDERQAVSPALPARQAQPVAARKAVRPATRPTAGRPVSRTPAPMRAAPKPQPVQEAPTQVFEEYEPEPTRRQPARPVRQQKSRVRQRPPRPNGPVRRAPAGMQAKDRRQ
ncbi:MAG: hypothetical protein DWQ04_23000 [Chloroflexi bacterium]|nr:MAG: hypothetical protein DWQ04_23000 [Chloroflexota bacterium]